MYFGVEAVFHEDTIDEIPSEVKNFVNSLNNKIKKVTEKDFRNTKFEATTNPQERNNAAISNNYNLAKQGTIIKITLPFNGVTYQSSTNPFSYIYKFIESEFKNSDLKDKYKYYDLRIYSATVIYATINPILDTDKDIDKLRKILLKDKFYDNSDNPVKYLDDNEIKEAIRTKEFFDSFKTKYRDKAYIFYNSNLVTIEIISKKHSSNPLMSKYIKLDSQYEKDIMALYDKSSSSNEDLSKEMNAVEDKFHEEKTNMFTEYIKSKLDPAIEYATSQTDIKTSKGSDISCTSGGGSYGSSITFTIHVYK